VLACSRETWVVDGDHPSKPLEVLHDDPIPAKGSKLIKQVQSMVKNYIDNPDSQLGHSFGNWPDFVWLVELNSEGVISCMPNPLRD